VTGPAALYICYSNLSDPLIGVQVVAYLRGLAARGVRVHLLTFERDGLTPEAEAAARPRLEAAGIAWHPFRHRTGPGLAAKARDFARGVLAAARLCVRHRVRLVHGRSHLAAAIGLLLKGLTGCRLVFDVRGLLAEEYVDVGHWRPGGVRFLLTRHVERVLLRRADGCVVLTDRLRSEVIRRWPRLGRGDLAVIPCCVDTGLFPDPAPDRDRVRAANGWADRLVLTYVGKIGTWYLPDELARFFAHTRRVDPRSFLAVFTQSDATPLREALDTAGVPADAYSIGYAPPRDLPGVLSACDAGLSFIKPCPSKRASSPTKLGEYLAAGLPVVANAGIGDCDELLESHRVGVVVRTFDAPGFESAAGRLRDLIADPGTRGRCRGVAETELSLETVGVPRYASLYSRLLGVRLAHANGSVGYERNPLPA
jgi:glycosyltransferase involved in cell wall biosynthesis